MRYWKSVIAKDCSYEYANNYINQWHGTSFITRPEWDGVHFYNIHGRYCILLKSGSVLVNPTTILNKDSEDWMVVTINEVALHWLQNEGHIERDDY